MNEQIPGTILIDANHATGMGAYARTTLPGVQNVQVDFGGEVVYAVTDDPDGSRVWWFAGTGNVHEDWTPRENAVALGMVSA